MPQYVDGFVIPIPKKNLPVYRSMAQRVAKLWRKHGALAFRECVGDDLKPQSAGSFPRRLKAKPGETVIFSWIVFKSRAHRDRVNAKVMKDPRAAELMDPKKLPFDCKRMVYGGFEVIVDA
jgi:uncharacterized protein YbaA (DUF1428 family)